MSAAITPINRVQLKEVSRLYNRHAVNPNTPFGWFLPPPATTTKASGTAPVSSLPISKDYYFNGLVFRSLRPTLRPPGRFHPEGLQASIKSTSQHSLTSLMPNARSALEIHGALRTPLDKDMDGPLQELLSNFTDFLEEVMLGHWQVINDQIDLDHLFDWATLFLQLRCHKIIAMQDALQGSHEEIANMLAAYVFQERLKKNQKLKHLAKGKHPFTPEKNENKLIIIP